MKPFRTPLYFILMPLLFSFSIYSSYASSATSAKQEPAHLNPKTAKNMNELLRMIVSEQRNEKREHSQREQQFLNSKSKQRQLLVKAEKKRHALKSKSTNLESTFKHNKDSITQLENNLKERLGPLHGVFSHLQAFAIQSQLNLDQSIISAQYRDRTRGLDSLINTLDDNSKLPKITDISALWQLLQQEMIESGKTRQFQADVIDLDGKREIQTVTRIGTFNLIANGEYLKYQGIDSDLARLNRQPDTKYLEAASLLNTDTQTGGTSSPREAFAFGIDPTGPKGGSFLSALISTPSLSERIEQGGTIGFIIIALGAFALGIALERFVVLQLISQKINIQVASKTIFKNNPLGRILRIYEQNHSLGKSDLELKLSEAILKELPPIERSINFLKIIAMIAPLMGLLGTVTGMIITFQAITLYGGNDPKTMAGGISSALITTVLGLCVAIPTVFLHAIISDKSGGIIHVLEEQSAGIVAEHSESFELSNSQQSSSNVG